MDDRLTFKTHYHDRLERSGKPWSYTIFQHGSAFQAGRMYRTEETAVVAARKAIVAIDVSQAQGLAR